VYQVIAMMQVLLRDASPHVDLSLYYYYWIFAPAHVYAVTAGIMMARRGLPSTRAGIAAAVLVVAGGIIADALVPGATAQRVITMLLDVPLTMAVLVGVRW